MKSKRNIYLDLLKLFAAYCVIFIHINTQVKAPTKISFPYAAIMAFVRFAVPLFFITSGYFSYKISSDRIKTRLKRTGILILISTIIYFAWSCFQERILLGHSLHKYLDVALSYKNLADFVFLEQNPFGVHLWYLNALFVIYVVFYFYTALQKNEQKPKYRPLYIIAATLFCVFNLVSVKLLANKHELPYLTYRNSCLMGLPFFATGLFLRQYRDRIFEKFKLKKTTLIVAIIACIAISAVQVIAYGKPTECPPFIAIAAALQLAPTREGGDKRPHPFRIATPDLVVFAIHRETLKSPLQMFRQFMGEGTFRHPIFDERVIIPVELPQRRLEFFQ